MVIIGHSPSKRSRKGTKDFLKVMSRFVANKRRYPNVITKVIEKISYDDCLNKFLSEDFKYKLQESSDKFISWVLN